ncbi:DUF6443 domain-containing protein [Mucilaginibacter flavus]|uniref:DUF6443 domain-containing protein n=1 Tax=Mucilaginibacter flavus TaxID=931504 RepID=UPI0025B381B1|nr:DUF6443 domain-containing protein [Mucilaginibacter flavus]MDN3584251.1 DUF6443 domain-containing protein [Mucilaginibacter flavus]
MKKHLTFPFLFIVAASLLFSIQGFCQTDNPALVSNNNIRTDIIKVSGVTSASQISPSNSQSRLSYMDGLGRPVQSVGIQASPLQKDIVQPLAYDKYGRPATVYLPYTATTTTGAYQSTAITDQASFYQQSGQQRATDNAPYAVTVYDQSPLDRVVESGAPGTNWQPGTHTVKPVFRLNVAADNIRIWTTAGPSAGYYAETTLSVNDVSDEGGHHILTFTNKLGQTVEKKVQGDSGTWLETVYIYDDLGNLNYQLSPEGVKRLYAGSVSWGATFTATWACVYSYDAKNRLVSKQAAGAAPVYMVYDSYNRLVLMQDGRIRNAYGTADKWYFTKYDVYSRVILLGLYTYATPPNATGTTNQQKLQNYLDGLVYDNTSTFAYEKRQAGTTYGYSSQCFPATVADADVLTVNYYDDYDFNNNGTPPNQFVNPNQSGFATACTIDAGGMLTGTKKRIINVSGNNGGWINQAVFYDNFGNPIQKQTNNLINQSALDISNIAYDIYAGHITQTLQAKTQGTAIKVLTTPTYDIQGRPQQVSIQINSNAPKVIAVYEYNELGQLKDKKLGNTTGSNYLQTVDFRYNIRGWITGINKSNLTDDSGTATNDIWGMTILYDQADASGGIVNTPRYNGQASAIKWKANDVSSTSTNPVRERGYAYAYDAIGRLLSAHYTANGGTSWNAEISGYDETITSYDQNGNIQGLTRNTLASGATVATTIDNLAYAYKNGTVGSNQLDAVKDNATGTTATMGFNDGANTTGEYQYDTNGNLTGDANKSQTITYNDLNKVSKIAVTGGGRIEYMYDASGTRIRKTVYNSSGTVINQLDYMDGFTYQNSALSYFNMPEGKVDVSGTNFTYEYFIADNLGNTRVSFVDNGSGMAKVVQENEYYAFGMTMQGMVVRTAQPTNANKLLYNAGNELQDDLGYENSYSTFYRDYDQVLGRFNAIDPMVDKYADWTPYNFAFNDPGNKNDPGGDDPNVRFLSPLARQAVQGGWSPALPPQLPSPDQQAAQMSQMAAGGWYQFIQDAQSWEQGAIEVAAEASANETAQLNLQNTVKNAMATPGDTRISNNGDGTFSVTPIKVQLVYTETGQIDPQTGEHFNVETSNYHYEIVAAFDNNQRRDPPLTHAQELAKYGYILQGFSAIGGGGILKVGKTIEIGSITTNKGWVQDYMTVYNTKTALALSGSVTYFNVSNKPGFTSTFSDWAGPVTEWGGNYGIVSLSFGSSTTYTTWSLGFGPGVSLPEKGTGTYNYGITYLLGSPRYMGPTQNNTGPISNWYINGGYNQ